MMQDLNSRLPGLQSLCFIKVYHMVQLSTYVYNENHEALKDFQPKEV